MIGFYIKQLAIKGNGLKDATISFKKGANLVTGASDTGKSYVFSAISYALGANEEPKDINEGIGYNNVYLEIEAYADETTYTLHREIGRNQIMVKQSSIEKFITSEKTYKKFSTTGQVDKDTHISTFLLSLCNLEKKRLLFNRTKGVTRNLSFDSLRKLTFVDEERIIKTASPFYYSSQFTNQTIGQSLLNLILTGNDDSDTVEKEDKSSKEARISGKLEFLSAQISQLASEKDEIVNSLKSDTANDSNHYLNLDQELQLNLNEAKDLTKRKNNITIQRQSLHEELIYTLELLNRFTILEKQYMTDTERLGFILESSALAAQLGDTICPICSSSLDDNHLTHLTEKENFKNATVEELKKNTSKLHGLKETMETLKNDEKKIRKEILIAETEMQEIEKDLENNFSPKIQTLKASLSGFLSIQKAHNELTFIDTRISKLLIDKDRLESILRQKNNTEEVTILSFALLNSLATTIESRLKKWNYESHVKVDFDSNYKIFDIVISGKSRKSYGKGKRSISYAACLFGLLDYCNKNSKGFSNLIIMDSPLTTFEEKKKQVEDINEVLTSQVLKSFFLDYANLPKNSQVIIFDNKEPDAETYASIKDKVNIEIFTGSNEGRSGFFPK